LITFGSPEFDFGDDPDLTSDDERELEEELDSERKRDTTVTSFVLDAPVKTEQTSKILNFHVFKISNK